VHRETIVTRLICKRESLARETDALGVRGVGDDGVSCVSGDRSRRRRGQGHRACQLDRTSIGVVGACDITSVKELAREDLRRLGGTTRVSLCEESVHGLTE
jgi:hypothetical protein